MAGINSTIRITDGMSPALKSMNKALTLVLNSFESLQRASGNSIDVAEINAARDALNDASASVNRLEDELSDAADEQDRLNDNIKKSDSLFSGLIGKVGALVAGYASIQGVMSAVNLSDEISQTEARLNLIVQTDENGNPTESVDELTKKIMQSANISRSSYLDTASIVASFAQRAGDAFNNNNDEVIAFAETLNKMYKIAGATQQEQSSSMLQLTQALGSGILRGEEFNAVFEAAPNIMQAVADYMEVPIGSLRDMASEGQITAEIVKNAIFAATNDVNEQFNTMPYTWSQVMTLLKNDAIEAFDPVLRKINELANNQKVSDFIVTLGHTLAAVANVALYLFEVVSDLFSFISENLVWFLPILVGITAHLIAQAGAWVINAAATSTNTIALVAHAAAMFVSAVATRSATTAQMALNTAFYACPIVWIVAGIMLLIVAIVKLCEWLFNSGNTATTVMGKIMGAVAVAGAFVVNIVIGVINAIIQFFWTYFVEPYLGIIEFVLNAANGGFNSFGDAVKNLIGQIISWFLSLGKVVTKIIDAIFGTDWTSGLNSLQDKVLSWGKNNDAITLDRTSYQIDRINYQSAYNAGAAFGNGIDFGILNNDDEGILNGTSDITYTPYDELVQNTGDISDGVSGINNKMEVTEEDLKYLRDIAEQEAINRFTTAEIKIDMQNNNSINSSMDIDGIVSQLEDKLYESMIVAAEGVH